MIAALVHADGGCFFVEIRSDGKVVKIFPSTYNVGRNRKESVFNLDIIYGESIQILLLEYPLS